MNVLLAWNGRVGEAMTLPIFYFSKIETIQKCKDALPIRL